jgi:hypothetical protein
MTTLRDLAGARLMVTWAVLVIATVVSWWLGVEHGSLVPVRVAVSLTLVVAYIKIWFIGADFMELRAAPSWLRRTFAAWLAMVGATTVVLSALV